MVFLSKNGHLDVSSVIMLISIVASPDPGGDKVERIAWNGAPDTGVRKVGGLMNDS